jgi:cytidine deaminase
MNAPTDSLPDAGATPPSGADGDALASSLVLAARRVRERAYAPYSGFAVGAAVVDEQGRIHVGCNVENAAYPQGLCAEAGALAALVASGGRRVLAAAVVGASHAADRPVMPCGGCRQRLREFAGPSMAIWLADEHRVLGHRTLDQLLPEGFGPADLGRAGPAT